MREFIGGFFFLIAFLTVVLAVISLVVPQKPAADGTPKLSKTATVFTAGFFFFAMLAIGLVIYPKAEKTTVDQKQTAQSQNAPAQGEEPSNVALVRSTYHELVANQDQFFEEIKLLTDLAQKGSRQTDVDKAELVMLMEAITKTLAKANAMQVPVGLSGDSKTYITAAIANHKQWANAQRGKMDAFLKQDKEAVIRMGVLADGFSQKEAIALSLAYNSIGLEF